MLSCSRTIISCGRCRKDLLNLFDRGFCGPATLLQHRQPIYERQLRAYQRAKPFTSAVRVHQRDPVHELQESQISHNEERVGEVDILEDQLAALRELEKQLGQNIEDAIEHDQLSALAGEGRPIPGASGSEQKSRTIFEAGRDPLATMRANKADVKEIVREARQIFGYSLPEGVLEGHEMKIYKRLYGDPEPENSGELEEGVQEMNVDHSSAVGVPDQREAFTENTLVDTYLQSSEDQNFGVPESAELNDDSVGKSAFETGPTETFESRIRAVAQSLGAQIVQEDPEQEMEEEDAEDSETYERMHPLTALGKFETHPSTVFLPKDALLQPTNEIMSEYSNKHLKEVAEKVFGGPGLPDSPLTPRSGRTRPQIPLPLEVSQHTMSQMEANAYLTVVVPPTYAAIISVLTETRKRLGPTWLHELLAKEGGPRVLDAGGAGAGILAWREIVDAHWKSMHDSGHPTPPPPPTRSVVVTGSDTLRHRAATLLDNTTFIPRLPDYVHTRDVPTLDDGRPAQQRKQFDVIIAPHMLFGLKEEWMRKQHIQNLWTLLNPNGGVLILIEKGIPRGFEAIAGARELLLDRYIATPEGYSTSYDAKQDEGIPNDKVTGMIIAPCTNHNKCPMYTIPGLSRGRKDYCSFQQRYQRPSYLQRVLGANLRNHDDVDFSYLSVMKGQDLRQTHLSNWNQMRDPLSAPAKRKSPAIFDSSEWTDQCHSGFPEITPNSIDSTTEPLPAPFLLPRAVFLPIKRRGHVILDLCTPSGEIERWTVPRSLSKQAFRDARKAQHGDLWALGAKTRVARNLKLGAPDGGGKAGRKARALEEKAQELLERKEEERLEEDLTELEEHGLVGLRKGPKRDVEDEWNEDKLDPEAEAAFQDWEAEYANDARRETAEGKKGLPKVGKVSKEARRMQKDAHSQRKSLENTPRRP